MHAVCPVCTLKRSPEPSNSESLAEVVLGALRDEDVSTDVIRLADHTIEPGVVSEAVSDDDEWPALRERILKAEILLFALPTWLGQPSSVAKRALERMDALISETKEDGETPIGYTLPGQNWTYWNKGPGPGEEEWLTTSERDWSISTGQAAAKNLLRTARELQ